MQHISLVFSEDLSTEDLSLLQRTQGCMGISAYHNTVNLYFQKLDTAVYTSLSRVLRLLQASGMLLAPQASLMHAYEAARSEATA